MHDSDNHSNYTSRSKSVGSVSEVHPPLKFSARNMGHLLYIDLVAKTEGQPSRRM